MQQYSNITVVGLLNYLIVRCMSTQQYSPVAANGQSLVSELPVLAFKVHADRVIGMKIDYNYIGFVLV